MTKKTILPLQLLVAPDKNDPAPLILYHGRNCPDGFGAALAAWLYYGDQAEYVGLDHGDVKTVDDLPPLQGRAVYILDFSFANEVMAAIDERAAKLGHLLLAVGEVFDLFMAQVGKADLLEHLFGAFGQQLFLSFFAGQVDEKPHKPDLCHLVRADHQVFQAALPEHQGDQVLPVHAHVSRARGRG